MSTVCWRSARPYQRRSTALQRDCYSAPREVLTGSDARLSELAATQRTCANRKSSPGCWQAPEALLGKSGMTPADALVQGKKEAPKGNFAILMAAKKTYPLVKAAEEYARQGSAARCWRARIKLAQRHLDDKEAAKAVDLRSTQPTRPKREGRQVPAAAAAY